MSQELLTSLLVIVVLTDTLLIKVIMKTMVKLVMTIMKVSIVMVSSQYAFHSKTSSLCLYVNLHSYFLECQCNGLGSTNASCDAEGKCTCNPNVAGDKCDQCAAGMFGFPNCQGMSFKAGMKLPLYSINILLNYRLCLQC